MTARAAEMLITFDDMSCHSLQQNPCFLRKKRYISAVHLPFTIYFRTFIHLSIPNVISVTTPDTFVCFFAFVW